MLRVTRCEFVHNLPCEQVSNRLTELQAENAKLRELCNDMYENPYALSECWECPHCVNGCISNCYYRNRMRELGIEVDGSE